MAWYYYTGKTVRPIPVKKGLSKAVRPHSRIEILEETIEVRALIRKGELRRTGKPKGATSVADEPVPEKTVKEAIGKSALARFFAEKGKTKAPSIPPVSKTGVELTEHEIEAEKMSGASPDKEEKEEDEASEDSEEVDDSVMLTDDSKRKGKRGRRR